ncbi:PREDICTED: nuclear RNA export factor 3-like [Chrysochloris asiatica]|uniref:Nuclear RNA export factor 3-like n=1 Tax=Chrysochloris asiatica TaxID=185453 RepID=A0A9B0TRX7_CHRAS|nr:PREDICTED: nuclear RNA export factor 3-like [Chrysochloris asiatica]
MVLRTLSFQGDAFGSETMKNLILKFLKQYYWIYDYGDRQGLLGAYHSEACFSLFIPFNPQDPASSLATYFRYSRNMKTCKGPNLRAHLLKHTKPDIVDFLSVLPRTQHDLNSFLVDVCVQTEKMLCFSVNGLFKEAPTRTPTHPGLNYIHICLPRDIPGDRTQATVIKVPDIFMK